MSITKLENLQGLIIDMDGVLWHGMTPMDGLNDFFSALREIGLPFILATNNASLTQKQYVNKLDKMGVQVSSSEIITSSIATVRYLSENTPSSQRRAFVIGEAGLIEPLEMAGFTLTELYEVDVENFLNADFVISGLDRQLNWDKLATATLCINNGAAFYATNLDVTLPTELGDVIGNGGVVAALEAATGVKAKSIGKPEPIIYDYALKTLRVPAENVIAIGDRLNTDILGAVNAGLRSILVLSGVSKEQDIEELDYQPTLVMKDLNEITTSLRYSFNLS